VVQVVVAQEDMLVLYHQEEQLTQVAVEEAED
jgi:hypothetical protein